MPTETIPAQIDAPKGSHLDQPGLGTVPDGQPVRLQSQVPVHLLCPHNDVHLHVAAVGEGVEVRPMEPLPCRCTIRVMAQFENRRSYHDIITIMGRLTFARGATEPQQYIPFTHDPQRTLRALYLPVETAPEDDQLASPQRWANAQQMAGDLLRVCNVPWRGLRPGDVDKLMTFPVHEDPIEACLMHALAQSSEPCGDVIIEIGSFRGRSLSVMALALDGLSSDKPLISVDPHVEQPINRQRVRVALREIGQEHRLVQIPLGSNEAAKFLRPGRASLIFIDGDHSYEQVVADIKNYDELLAPGGYMVIHDYGWGAHTQGADPDPHVRRAVDELLFGNDGYAPVACARSMLAFVKAGRPA